VLVVVVLVAEQGPGASNSGGGLACWTEGLWVESRIADSMQ
jgi:hypothetical protein